MSCKRACWSASSIAGLPSARQSGAPPNPVRPASAHGKPRSGQMNGSDVKGRHAVRKLDSPRPCASSEATSLPADTRRKSHAAPSIPLERPQSQVPKGIASKIPPPARKALGTRQPTPGPCQERVEQKAQANNLTASPVCKTPMHRQALPPYQLPGC